MGKKILIVAGEFSGDLHGAALVRSLISSDSSLEIFALGGKEMELAGAKLIDNLVELATFGFFESLKKYFIFQKIYRNKVVPYLRSNRPDAVILIDFYGFNIQVARLAKELGIPVIYYISPQIWASRFGRIEKLSRYVDKMIVILPFEEEIYRNKGMAVSFVGHPLLDYLPAPQDKIKICRFLGLNHELPIVGFLPGSREQEIKYLLPVMLKLINNVMKKIKIQPVMFLAPNLNEKKIGLPPHLKYFKDEDYSLRQIADISVAASGTVTLENAVLGIPTIILYKLSYPTYLLAKMLVKVPYIGMPNILAREKILPEFIQDGIDYDKILAIMELWLTDNSELLRIKSKLAKVTEKLGRPGVSEKVAKLILEVLNG